MRNTCVLYFMIFTVFLAPFVYLSAGEDKPGIEIFSQPGSYKYETGSPPVKWEVENEIVVNPEQTGNERLSKPFPNRTETKVYMVGNSVLVPVKLGYKNKALGALMIFDTGAAITTLYRSAGEKLGIAQGGSGKISIADGTVIDSQNATLDYIIVGPFRIDNFQAVIIDHKNDSSEKPVKGLLGMNFLKQVNYKIDFAQKVIKWSDK